ncbi:hypothetical protein T07_2690 [Trichinella nelsoni]|uniref:Uncharacterized protein n=1 Tax=Trichinella nelsoni TaxID=6336 RepID=A0A0V0RJ64_9BILA|nr:hypothetical protein T07_2690 [Trichinella nelsoni]
MKQNSNEIVIANAIDDVNLIVNENVDFCSSFPSISSAYWHPDVRPWLSSFLMADLESDDRTRDLFHIRSLPANFPKCPSCLKYILEPLRANLFHTYWADWVEILEKPIFYQY